MEHAHHVPADPVFNDLSLLDAVDAYPRPLRPPVRRLYAHQPSLVGPAGYVAGHHFVCFGDLVLQHIMQIRKRFVNLAHEVLVCRDAMNVLGIRTAVLMAYEVGGENLVGYRQVAFAPLLL